jgi:hypothetical protein
MTNTTIAYRVLSARRDARIRAGLSNPALMPHKSHLRLHVYARHARLAWSVELSIGALDVAKTGRYGQPTGAYRSIRRHMELFPAGVC